MVGKPYWRVKEDGTYWQKTFSTLAKANVFAKERRDMHIGTGNHGIHVFKHTPKKRSK